MVDQLMLQTIGILLTGISLTVAAFYYTITIRNQNRNRQAQLKLQFFNTFRPEFLSKIGNIIWHQEFSTFEEWSEKYGPRVDPEVHASTLSVLYTLNSVGMFLRERYIDPHSLFQFWNPLAIKGTWHKIEPVIKYWREYFEYPELFESFEYMVNEARKIAPKDIDVLPS